MIDRPAGGASGGTDRAFEWTERVGIGLPLQHRQTLSHQSTLNDHGTHCILR
jgi:hypothetical protein